MIDTSTAPPPPTHFCDLPNLWDPSDEEATDRFEIHPPSLAFPVGTTYTCDDCGDVYVLTWRDGYVAGNVGFAPRIEWEHETKSHRRARLGLRWWQKEHR